MSARVHQQSNTPDQNTTTMASARTRILLLVAALLCAGAAAASSSWGGGDGHGHDDDQKKAWRCVRRCADRPSHQRARCVEQCRQQQQQEQEQEQERERGGGRDEAGRRGDGSSSSGDDEPSQSQGGRPYVFDGRSFRRIVRSEQGSVRALRRFGDDEEDASSKKLLRGVRDYRVAVLEASPRSFVVPSHADAHCVAYVLQGEGVVTAIDGGERRSYTIKQGHVFVAPAGTVVYLANTDGRRKLVIAKILQTISVPGQFQLFVGPGGRNPESFLASFSKGILRAAYKQSSDERLERLWGKRAQRKDAIVRATEEQIRELRRQASDSGGPHWPFQDSHGPYGLLDQRPTIGNQHGQLYEADARSFRDLADHDVAVSFANITAGSMIAPLYNTRSWKIAYVQSGQGELEIVCPHQESQSKSQGGESGKGRRRSEEEEEEGSSEEEEEAGKQGYYHAIRARLSPGTAFVVPVGHPYVVVASRDSNLQVVCFDVRAHKNEKVFLAGADNVLGKLDRVAKALSFADKAEVVDEVLRARQEKGFLPGPEKESGSRREEQEEEEERGGGREEREEEEEERGGGRRHGGRGKREEEEEERGGRRGRGRREEVAETFLRMATAAAGM